MVWQNLIIPIGCFEIELVTGRFFQEDSEQDYANAIVINETGAKLLGHTSASILGVRIQNFYVDSAYREVIGVVKDYNFNSLRSHVEPLAIAQSDWKRIVAIKIDADQVSEAIVGVRSVYEVW